LIFSTTLVWNMSISEKKWTRYSHKCIFVFTQSKLFLSHFNETWIFSTAFRKILSYKIALNTSSGSRVVPCGWTDRYAEANSRFSQFCPKTLLFGFHSHCGTDVAIQTRNCRHIADTVKQQIEYGRLWSLHVINTHSGIPEPELHHYIITSLGLV
jgi:hypothetical protein